MLAIQTLPAHPSNYTAEQGRAIAYLVVHYTGNRGDTARGNCLFFQGASRGASAHYFVDESSIFRSVLEENRAWHCGTTGEYFHPDCRNGNSIGVELCSDWNGVEYFISPQTIANSVELLHSLMERHHIDAAHVLRHYDVTHKICPRPFVEHPQQWVAFKQQLEDMDMLTQTQFDELMDRYLAARAAQAPGEWSAESRRWAEEQGILTGDVGGSKQYKSFCTREQLAVFLKRMSDRQSGGK